MDRVEPWAVARNHRNKLLIGDPDIPDDSLAHSWMCHSEMMLQSGISVSSIFEEWRESHRSSSYFERGAPPACFGLINVGQSITKLVSVGLSGEEINCHSFRTPPIYRPNDFIEWIRSLIADYLMPDRGRKLHLYLAIAALVGAVSIIRFPNGIFRELSSVDIGTVSYALSGFSQNSGVPFDSLVLLNDGLLASVLHRQSTPGQTLVLRVGTNLCGGLDTIRSLGELGWMRPMEYPPIPEVFSSYRDDRSLIRHFLSAETFYTMLKDGLHDLLIDSVTSTIRAVANVANITDIVLVGTAFEELMKVGRLQLEEKIARISPQLKIIHCYGDFFSPSAILNGMRFLHAEHLPYVKQGAIEHG